MRGLCRAAPQQEPLEDRLDHLLRVDRHGHADAQRLLDAAVLVDEDVENNAVDTVVGPVEKGDLHRGLPLAVAIHAALTLLMAGGIPGEVVMDDGIEGLLQVDALGQAVGGDEQPLIERGEFLDSLLALGRR